MRNIYGSKKKTKQSKTNKKKKQLSLDTVHKLITYA